MRCCRTCREGKDVSEFYDTGRKISTECKVCARKRTNRNWTNLRKGRPEYAIWKSAKDRAAAHGREFTLKLEDVVIPPLCPVLGIPLVPGLGRGVGMGLEHRDKRPSIDRLDNSKGYTPENIVIVSYRANRIKSDASVSEIQALAAFYGGKNASD